MELPQDLPQGVYVVWKDHDTDCHNGPWYTHEAASDYAKSEPTIVYTLGWLYEEDEETLTVVCNVTRDYCGSSLDRIVKKHIISIQRGPLIQQLDSGK